jgi:hypothetical protein
MDRQLPKNYLDVLFILHSRWQCNERKLFNFLTAIAIAKNFLLLYYFLCDNSLPFLPVTSFGEIQIMNGKADGFQPTTLFCGVHQVFEGQFLWLREGFVTSQYDRQFYSWNTLVWAHVWKPYRQNLT